ncbi:uncharacterized protein LOC129789477 [Lutzomyia longipalpis]|uniref:uncharacterized protein LOC129789476 n=1 Tax=Lutzomyia longipalpis TaxID=7200 RepID=UPI00248453AB|nr:uncharacterized protein LOC129789476 [Lutzomyia longipalpis]XP_055682280.1 uncharacterized protein LOC129789477 [Lutzomyia longipalpis]
MKSKVETRAIKYIAAASAAVAEVMRKEENGNNKADGYSAMDATRNARNVAVCPEAAKLVVCESPFIVLMSSSSDSSSGSSKGIERSPKISPESSYRKNLIKTAKDGKDGKRSRKCERSRRRSVDKDDRAYRKSPDKPSRDARNCSRSGSPRSKH